MQPMLSLARRANRLTRCCKDVRQHVTSRPQKYPQFMSVTDKCTHHFPTWKILHCHPQADKLIKPQSVKQNQRWITNIIRIHAHANTKLLHIVVKYRMYTEVSLWLERKDSGSKQIWSPLCNTLCRQCQGCSPSIKSHQSPH